MRALVKVALPCVSIVAIACGARSSLPGEGGGEGGASNSGGASAAGGSSTTGGAGGSGAAPTWCASWVASEPVRVSDSPGNNMSLQDARVVASCVLVGYANIDFPPADSTWRIRQVCFDGSMAEPYGVLRRDTSELGWTAVSIAGGFGRAAATAWDRVTGMQLVAIEDDGMAAGQPVLVSDLPGRGLLATTGGYSVLQSPFDAPRAPVVLSPLDSAGLATGSPIQLVDASFPITRVSRASVADGSFVLAWTAEDGCDGCLSLYAQHLSETGKPIGTRALVHEFASDSVRGHTLAASSSGFVAAWPNREPGEMQLLVAAFDTTGQSVGSPRAVAASPGSRSEAFALGAVPSGELLGAWSRHAGGREAQLVVQPLTPAGVPFGSETVATTFTPTNDKGLLIVASREVGMVLYEDDVPSVGAQVFAIPLKCAERGGG